MVVHQSSFTSRMHHQNEWLLSHALDNGEAFCQFIGNKMQCIWKHFRSTKWKRDGHWATYDDTSGWMIILHVALIHAWRIEMLACSTLVSTTNARLPLCSLDGHGIVSNIDVILLCTYFYRTLQCRLAILDVAMQPKIRNVATAISSRAEYLTEASKSDAVKPTMRTLRSFSELENGRTCYTTR